MIKEIQLTNNEVIEKSYYSHDVALENANVSICSCETPMNLIGLKKPELRKIARYILIPSTIFNYFFLKGF
jgi:hypothetical protein